MARKKRNDVIVTLGLTKELHEALNKKAEEMQIAATEVMRIALREYLNKTK